MINNTDGNGVDFVSPQDLGRLGIIVHDATGVGLAAGLGKLKDGSPVGWEVRAKVGGGFTARVGLLPVTSPEFHTDTREGVLEALSTAVADLEIFWRTMSACTTTSEGARRSRG